MPDLFGTRIVRQDVNVPDAENVGFPKSITEPTTEWPRKQAQCPRCGTVYNVPAYEVDVECRSASDGSGCLANDYNYWDDSTNGYVDGYWPFVFSVKGGDDDG